VRIYDDELRVKLIEDTSPHREVDPGDYNAWRDPVNSNQPVRCGEQEDHANQQELSTYFWRLDQGAGCRRGHTRLPDLSDAASRHAGDGDETKQIPISLTSRSCVSWWASSGRLFRRGGWPLALT
jgi:hypothetical protein